MQKQLDLTDIYTIHLSKASTYLKRDYMVENKTLSSYENRVQVKDCRKILHSVLIHSKRKFDRCKTDCFKYKGSRLPEI